MKRLGARSTHWLKTVHIVFGGIWLAGAISIVAMQTGLDASSGGELHGYDLAKKFIDDLIIIPAAIGTLLTGIVYSALTRWGFFRHRWVIVKWAITIVGIVIGTFMLGPWLNAMPPLSGALGLDALTHPDYLRVKTLNTWMALFQVSSLILAMWLSVFKPWAGSKSRKSGKSKTT